MSGTSAGLSHLQRKGVDFVFVSHPSYMRQGLYSDTSGVYGDNQASERSSCTLLLSSSTDKQEATQGSSSGCSSSFCRNSRLQTAYCLSMLSEQCWRRCCSATGRLLPVGCDVTTGLITQPGGRASQRHRVGLVTRSAAKCRPWLTCWLLGRPLGR